ncbi:MAG: HEAT repeat domain-containing protein [Bdellovibrionales bacterium]|nr:HEAT repeat domain-containing protein [Bdellovibrionales bacterium]
MVAAKEGRPPRKRLTLRLQRPSLRAALAALGLGIAFVSVLALHKQKELDALAQEKLAVVAEPHVAFRNLFQASFYFYFQEQFLPGVRRHIQETPGLQRVQILSGGGGLLFDSAAAEKFEPDPNAPEENIPPFGERQVVARLGKEAPGVFAQGFRVRILMPAGQYAILYTFEAVGLRNRLAALLGAGLLIASALGMAAFYVRAFRPVKALGRGLRRVWGLRVKFLLTIFFVNALTGGVVYFTLSEYQSRELAERIERESVLFTQFSTEKIVQDFSNYFYFYFRDKFLPSVKQIVATNENLVSLRVISNRTRAVLFDSEHSGQAGVPGATGTGERAQLTDEEESLLLGRGLVVRNEEREGRKQLFVTRVYRNENGEPLFLVEFAFHYLSLDRAVGAIRRRILMDLLPSMALGLLIGVVFSQLLISPIRRLVGALRRVSEGDYESTLHIRRADEIGDLVQAFNAMTSELRKKQELKKYLSDTTYRRIMAAQQGSAETRVGGKRVAATVLFSDIRNFVTHVESMEPEEVTSMLNEYFSEMVEVVHKHGGEVDKFIGDALLAVFYDDEDTMPRTATSLKAVYCALEMKERLADFNERRAQSGKNVLEIGVGITHGEIISGPIGSKDRMDFTVIGDVVNLASRIEGISKQGRHTRICFSQHVEDRLKGLVDYEPIGEGRIRGKTEDVAVYELVRIRELSGLLQNLETADRDLRVGSVELLGHSQNPDAIAPLLHLLRDGDERIRVASAGALVRLSPRDYRASVDAFFERLEVEKSEKVISALITGLGRMCGTERLLDLRRYLDAPDHRISANAVEAIGRLRSPRSLDLVLPLLSSRNNRVKANAAMALFSAGHLEVIETLKPMLMHSDPLMRSSAAFAIGELARTADAVKLVEEWRAKGREVKVFLAELQQCVPMLVALLRDPEPMVKRQAVIALGKIRDRSSVLPILDTLEPGKDSKELIRDITQALQAIGSHKLVREVLERLG